MSSDTYLSAQHNLNEALRAMDDGDPEEALRFLTDGFHQDASYLPLYELASQCCRQLESAEQSELFQKALESFQDARPFYNLGHHFVEQGDCRLAIPFLKRSVALATDDKRSLLELGVAYAGNFNPAAGRQVLFNHKSDDFWLAFQYYWCSLLCGITDDIETFTEDCRILASTAPPEDRDIIGGLTDKLQECQSRLKQVESPRPLIRDWHFIQYGAAILDYHDDRVEEDALSATGGRYVIVWPSERQVASILHRLRLFLETRSRRPKQVVALPDRDSRILALALSKILGLPAEDFGQDKSEEAGSLIVASGNLLPEVASFRDMLLDETLFAFNLNWLISAPCTPDVAGLLSQHCIFPWAHGRIQIDPDSHKVRKIDEEDPRSEKQIAEHLLSIEPDEDPDWQGTLNFYKSVAPYLKGGELGGSQRLVFQTDSPVPGTYFA